MKNFGKKAGIAVLCAVFTFFTMGFFSCSNEIIGYSVVLWNIPEANIADGEVVPVYMKSNISKTYLIGNPEGTERIEIPLWKITEPESKGKAKKYADTNAKFNKQYAVSVIDGLPIRKEPNNVAKQVYRMRKGEIIRTCYIGKGEAPMNGRTPLEGDWYKVLTSTGIEGWCFSYNLRTFEVQGVGSYDYDGEGIIKVEDSSHLIETALASQWYPEYYSKMINKKEINLQYMHEDYGFDPGSESGTIKLKLQNIDANYPYEGVVKTSDGVYKFTGTPITMTVRDEHSMILRFTDDEGKPSTVYFVTFDEDVPALIQGEKARRDRVYSTLKRSGPTYNSTMFGVLTFTGGTQFQWSGFDNLQPAVIPGDAGHGGTYETKYFLPSSLKGVWDGVLSFHFNGVKSEVNFLYKMDNSGLRLTPARVVITKDQSSGRDVATVSLAGDSQMMVFYK